MTRRHTTNTRPKTKLLKYLPKAATAVTFQNPIFSPGRDKHRHFSGPIIPEEARRRPRSGATTADDDGGLGSTQEPSSPKVSCIGQIKLHKDKNKNKNKNDKDKKRDGFIYGIAREEAKKKESKILKMFGFGSWRKGESAGEESGCVRSEAAPCIGQMKRYTSGRQSLTNFDWSAQIAPVSDMDDRNCHSDEEFGRYSDGDEDEDDVIIPFSAPLVMGMSKPRREINLWQRRNTSSPPPIKLRDD